MMKYLNTSFRHICSLFLAAIILLSSCSEDGEQVDPVSEDLRDVELGLANYDNFFQLPEGLINSQDAYAQTVASLSIIPGLYIGYVQAFMTIPDEAVRIPNKVTATNARTNDAVETYEWNYEGYGSIVYQITDRSDEYFIEIFVGTDGSYTKLLDGAQGKNGKYGSMNIYGEDSADTAAFEWEINDDGSSFFTFLSDDSYLEVVSNEDLSGQLKIYENSMLINDMVWDAAGNGTYTAYDESGNITDTQSWTAS